MKMISPEALKDIRHNSPDDKTAIERAAQAQLEDCEKECGACADGFISTHEQATNKVREIAEEKVRGIFEVLDLDNNFVQDLKGLDEYGQPYCQTWCVAPAYIDIVAKEKGGDAYYLIKLPYSVVQALKLKEVNDD